jgi:hypothetical protein
VGVAFTRDNIEAVSKVYNPSRTGRESFTAPQSTRKLMHGFGYSGNIIYEIKKDE